MFGRKDNKDQLDQPKPRISVTGAFGKCPWLADFVQLDSNWRDIKEIDELLQTAYLSFSRQASSGEFLGCGILRTGGEDRQGVVALVYPSEDSAGRVYPMVLFHHLKDSGFHYKPDALYSCASACLSAATNKDSIMEITPSEDVLAKLGSLPEHQTYLDARSSKRAGMTALEAVTFGEWLDDLCGSDESQSLDMLIGIVSLIKMLKQQRVHRAYGGIRFPLPATKNSEIHLGFWLQILSTVMSGFQWRPDMIWTSLTGNSELYVLSRPLTASTLETTQNAERARQGFLGWQDCLTYGQSEQELVAKLKPWLARRDVSMLDVAIEWYQLV